MKWLCFVIINLFVFLICLYLLVEEVSIWWVIDIMVWFWCIGWYIFFLKVVLIVLWDVLDELRFSICYGLRGIEMIILFFFLVLYVVICFLLFFWLLLWLMFCLFVDELCWLLGCCLGFIGVIFEVEFFFFVVNLELGIVW